MRTLKYDLMLAIPAFIIASILGLYLLGAHV
jgi:hypothetical protein